MIIDIRRALEVHCPNAMWDFSIPNEGGDELQYNAIKWSDPRPKPAWANLVATADGFAAADLLAMRQGMVVGPLQLRRALRQCGLYQSVIQWISTQEEEIQEAWEYAGEFKRLDPFVVAAVSGLVKTDEEIDQVFQLAITL